MQNFSYSLWLHVIKFTGSLKRLKSPKPRHGSSPFSYISSLLLKDMFFFYIVFVITAADVVLCGGPKKVSPYIIQSTDYVSFGYSEKSEIYNWFKFIFQPTFNIWATV